MDKFLASAERVCRDYNVSMALGDFHKSDAALKFLEELCVPTYWGADGRLYAGYNPDALCVASMLEDYV